MRFSDGAVERLRGAVAATTFADRYLVHREAGAGGMGRVYDATERSSGRRLAIKVLAERGTGDARFAAEVETLERLDHPAIVGYVGHGTTEAGEPYLAMAWLEGEALSARLASGPPLTIAEVVGLAARLAGALRHAHDAGVVHRDLKPSNVFLVARAPAQATLIDFGVAKDAAAGRDLTHTGQLVGTPGYMAPEQARGDRDIDGRADLFALGGLIFECLVGEPAFGDEDVMVVLARLLLHDAPRIRTRRPDVPFRVDALVARLLAKEPADRLADAGAVATELEAIADALARGDATALATSTIDVSPARVEAPQAATVAGRPRPRRRSRGWLVGVGLVGVVASIVAVAWRPAARPALACTARDASGCEALCTDGHAEACRELGSTLLYGRHGIAVDVARGRAIFDRACTGGDGNACVSLAMYLRRHPEAGEPATWIALLERACAGGFALGCTILAEVYEGESAVPGSPGVRPDVGLARHYFEAGCALHESACLQYAEHVRRGLAGGAADPAGATTILRAACARGDAHACQKSQ